MVETTETKQGGIEAIEVVIAKDSYKYISEYCEKHIQHNLKMSTVVGIAIKIHALVKNYLKEGRMYAKRDGIPEQIDISYNTNLIEDGKLCKLNITEKSLNALNNYSKENESTKEVVVREAADLWVRLKSLDAEGYLFYLEDAKTSKVSQIKITGMG